MSRRSRTLAEALLRRAIRLYPPDFRARLGEDLLATLLHRHGEVAGRGWLRAGAWTAAALAQLLVGAAAERTSRSGRGAGRVSVDGSGPASRGRGGAPSRSRLDAALDAAGQLARHAARRLRADPGTAAAVVFAFTIGIGANATVYRIADRLLLSPPPHLHEPERLRLVAVELWSDYFGRRHPAAVRSYPELEDWRAATGVDDVAGYDFAIRELTVGAGEGARRLRTQAVTGGYFPLLGTRPLLGRVIGPADDRVGAEDVVVISAGVWRRDFGGSPDVLGRTLELDRGAHRIVGVAPEGFTGVELAPVDAWIPLAPYRARLAGAEWDRSRQHYWLRVVARLREDVPEEAAAAELTTLHLAAADYPREATETPPDPRVVLASVVPGRSPLRPAEVDVARWLSGITLVLLLLSCVNVANLLLAREVRDRRRTAISLALGASRQRVAAQVGAETFALALVGAAAASLVAAGLGGPLRRLLLPDVAWPVGRFDEATLGLAVALAAGAAVVAAALPGLRASRGDEAATLRSTAEARETRRTRAALVVTQVALSCLLLVGAGVFVRSFAAAVSEDLGIDPERAWQLQLVEDVPEAEEERLFAASLSAVAALPGMESVGASSTFPFFQRNGAPLRVEGWDTMPEPAMVNAVSGDYFGALGLRLARGRLLDEGDVGGAPPVAVVNRAMAERLWPAGALGRCLYIGRESPPCTEVVGVVEDARILGVGSEAPLQYYVSAAQQTPVGGLYLLLARLHPGAGAAVVGEARRALLAVDPRVRFVDAQPVGAALDSQLRPWRLGAVLFGIFGALALLLAGIGLHALLSFDVSQRRRELGVRSALGATTTRLVGHTLARGIGLAGIGLAVGLAGAWALAPRLEGLLFDTAARDGLSFAIVAASLLVAATAAAAFPARRAARAEPLEVIRAEG